MVENLRNNTLAAFGLTPDQEAAALERTCDVAVTAGAGSGKTKTLVARYVSLLADGYDLRRVIAITFTDKAALEMRSRVRETLSSLVVKAATQDEREYWTGLNAEMDSARIGTIHSLCAEILRSHPVEAAIDPKFDVLDEGLSAALRMQVVDDCMAALVGMPEFAPLFQILEIKGLKDLLSFLLNKRLEAQEALDKEVEPSSIIQKKMGSLLHDPPISTLVNDLKSMSASFLIADGGEKLADQIRELVELWGQAKEALAGGDPVTCAGYLYQARRNKMLLTIGSKNSSAKEVLRQLQNTYDEILNPICGGASRDDEPPDEQTEARFSQALPLARSAFKLLTAFYRQAQEQLAAVDFDDLEYQAARLLGLPAIHAVWQAQVDALLVDEFQDTNERQRLIVEALAGSAGKLFVVGDAKQSIYRFRRADVSVFRSIRRTIRERGGLPIDLDQTFRAHAALLDVMNDLFPNLMGIEEDPDRPYYEPFAPMRPYRETPRDGMCAPHLEFVFGMGEKAEDGRQASARGLVSRLLELKGERQIRSWDDVTLLFRASSGFPTYENAFEEANIPFVTIAGKGFYERAEIRDILNILRALADPSDDLAMAGLLRSPAFGLSDSALYQLRWQGDTPAHFWATLNGDLSFLSPTDGQLAQRTFEILDRLIPQVDRIPVAELLKKLVDETHYRAILAIDGQGGGARLWRNLDKLIEDAQASGKINVRDFLDYLSVINDAGAREGEAPAEALGAVRLMTIHKSKGLQFPLVVLADASRKPHGGRDSAYLQTDLGLAFKLDTRPLLFRLAKLEEKHQDEAEEQRVLYVALTRAEEKLMISGHVTRSSKGVWSGAAWLDQISAAAQVDATEAAERAGEALTRRTPSGHAVRVWAGSLEIALQKEHRDEAAQTLPEAEQAPIYAPLFPPAAYLVAEDEEERLPGWRATAGTDGIPSTVVGTMVHKALALWLFPGNPRLMNLLETLALDEGLVQAVQRQRAVEKACSLLTRFHEHPLRQEIEAAHEVYHELPYSRYSGELAETGYMDLLFRGANGWRIIDFKTDHISSLQEKEYLQTLYTSQVRKYLQAVRGLMKVDTSAGICFLDDHGRVDLALIE